MTTLTATTTETATAGPLKDDLDAILDRMTQTANEHQARRQRLEVYAATQPQSVTCRRHPNQSRPIDLDESSRDTGYKSQEAGQDTFVIQYRPCPECEIENKMAAEESWLKAAGVPEKLLTASFATFRVESPEDDVNLSACRQFARVRRGFLILTGSFGDGKSFLAAAILREFLAGKFTTHNELLFDLRRSYGNRNAEDVIKTCQRSRLLVIDDFGLSSGGRDELPMLQSILDHRYGEKLPTVMTSNDPIAAIHETLGPRLTDRLKEATFRHLVFTGPSSRATERNSYFE